MKDTPTAEKPNALCEAKTERKEQCKNRAVPGYRFCRLHCFGRLSHVPWWQTAWSFLTALIIGVGATWYYGSNGPPTRSDAKRAAMAGTIIPSRKHMVISAAGARMAILNTNGVFLTDGQSPLVSLHYLNGKIMVSADIRNEQGELIAALKDNEWQLNKDLIFDRNYSDVAVEVRDKRGNVVLQVASLGETTYFAGILRCRTGKVVAILNNNGVPWFYVSPGMTLPQDIKIDAIFEYPSELHFGSCPGYEKLRAADAAITNASDDLYVLHASVDVCVGGYGVIAFPGSKHNH